MDKQFLRTRSKQILSTLDIKYLSAQLSIGLFQFLSSIENSHCIIGAFAPLSSEPHWFGAQAESLNFAFPRESKNKQGMEFALSKISDLEERLSFGTKIKVPSASAVIVTPDVLLIPGLAFGKSGERLGRGGGWFDRYLKEFQGEKVGVCFEAQLCSDLIMEEHDCFMEKVITERHTYNCKRS